MVRLIAQLLRPYSWLLLIALATLLVQIGTSLLDPWPFKILIDGIGSNIPPPHWASWLLPMLGGGSPKMRIATLAAVLLMIITAIWGIAVYVTNFIRASIYQWVGNDLRIRIYHHLQRLSLSYYHTHQVGNILSTITTDVVTMQYCSSVTFFETSNDLILIAGMVVVMFVLKWDIALIAVAVVPLLLFFGARIGLVIRAASVEVRKRQSDVLAAAEEDLESIEAVEAFEREDLEERQLADISQGVVQAGFKARNARALLSPVITIPIYLCTAFVFWRGTSLLLAGTMTLGLLSVFVFYLGKFFTPLQDFAQQVDPIAQTVVAAQRIKSILDADEVVPESPDATDPPSFRGHIAFEHVNFGYDAEAPLLRDICFTVDPGQLVGIVGPTGSGKSTVVSLIARFYDANSGRITIDGLDIKDFTLHGLRSQIGFVLQDTVLFRGTVHDNIAFGRPDATREEVVAAAKLANADEFITRMPNGYDSLVGERGTTLSGGQRQRIGIARALIRDDPVLILDEPTAALDAHSERSVIEALERLIEGRTVVCIAHRLSTIRDASKIVVLKDGVVAENGTHHELLALDGVYAELHRIQYGDDSEQTHSGAPDRGGAETAGT
jgi:ABC-type multidrug transport system fused ATPase/permease subunit